MAACLALNVDQLRFDKRPVFEADALKFAESIAIVLLADKSPMVENTDPPVRVRLLSTYFEVSAMLGLSTASSSVPTALQH